MVRADKYTSIGVKDQIFSDFLADLNPHPESKDIVKFTNENAVKRSIKNLILTMRYERLWQPDLGSDTQRMLFEPMNDVSAELLKDKITSVIINHEKRCKLLDVTVTAYEEQNLYAVRIVFAITNKQDAIVLDIPLYRVR